MSESAVPGRSTKESPTRLRSYLPEVITHTIAAFVPVIGIVVGEKIIESAGGEASWWLIGSVAVISLLSVGFTVFVASKMVGLLVERNMGEITERLEGVTDSLNKIILGVSNKLITTDKTTEIELAATKICVVTRDFYWDLRHDFKKTTSLNINRGAKYLYICPDTGGSKAAVEDLLSSIYEGDEIRVIYLPEIEMKGMLFEFVLYDTTDEIRAKGVVVDIFGRRFTDPEQCIDLEMDRNNVLPAYKQLVESWTHGRPVLRREGRRPRAGPNWPWPC